MPIGDGEGQKQTAVAFVGDCSRRQSTARSVELKDSGGVANEEVCLATCSASEEEGE